VSKIIEDLSCETLKIYLARSKVFDRSTSSAREFFSFAPSESIRMKIHKALTNSSFHDRMDNLEAQIDFKIQDGQRFR
jgi:hypothetical protein